MFSRSGFPRGRGSEGAWEADRISPRPIRPQIRRRWDRGAFLRA
ncbi:hypothetical protein chiPu_0025113, partial [Chiloscyllium punctatum]|nr:hypothetical protein [Chiloscyllium punctatum]